MTTTVAVAVTVTVAITREHTLGNMKSCEKNLQLKKLCREKLCNCLCLQLMTFLLPMFCHIYNNTWEFGNCIHLSNFKNDVVVKVQGL
jgi:hypothetical protein